MASRDGSMLALILAGGLGKRLRPLTDKLPKPLIEVAGKTIAEWQVEWLKEHGFRRIVFCVGYLAEKFVERLGDGSGLGVEIQYSVEREQLGTGGALKNAEELCADEARLLVVNGDVITDLDPSRVFASLEGAVGAVSLVPLPSIYGIVTFDEQSLIVREFKEKPLLQDYWINAGVYGFAKEIFSYLPARGSLETDSLPTLASTARLKAVPYRGVFWKSIETHKDLDEVEKFLSRKA
jgi:NDP-sugar pyrophosphorylase family protein